MASTGWRDARVYVGILLVAGWLVCPWGTELVTQAQIHRGLSGIALLALAIMLAAWEVMRCETFLED